MFEKEIIFSSPLQGHIEDPKPSLLNISKDYKNLSTMVSHSNKISDRSVKACMPFLDAMTMGYIIPFPVDVGVTSDIEKKVIDFEVSQFYPDEALPFFRIEDHHQNQMPPNLRNRHRTTEQIFKMLNPWHIKTPKGYSCIFTQPFNTNLPFKIIDGIVDTDEYTQTISFPFFWTQDLKKQKTIIPQGTPMACVIPFKREAWKMKTRKDAVNTIQSKLELSTKLIDSYKKLFWKKKSFR